MNKFLDKAGLSHFWHRVKSYIDEHSSSGSETGGVDSGEVYSTEETRIGTWIDGKPLYRKCYVKFSKPNSQYSTNIVDAIGYDVDEIINISGYSTQTAATSTSATTEIFLNSHITESSSNKYFYAYIKGSISDTLENRTVSWRGYGLSGSSSEDTCKFVFIFEYTKTTD